MRTRHTLATGKSFAVQITDPIEVKVAILAKPPLGRME